MYSFIFENARNILNRKEEKVFSLNGYRFKVLGEGTYGVVFKVIFGKKTFIAKIMKKTDTEPETLEKIKKKTESLKDEKVKELVKKYLTNVLEVNIKSTPEVIILEYLQGSDLSEYLHSLNYLNEEEYYIILTKLILSVCLLHSKLKFSHRDLKPGNIFYNFKNKQLKLIDFGFSCPLNDYNCFNKYQGTGNYIHPRMNNKKINNLLGGSLYGIKTKKNNVSNNRSFSSNKNNATLARFPKPRSQDIFSLIIIILNLYMHLDIDTNIEEGKLEKALNIFFSHGYKHSNQLRKYRSRYDKKKKLLTTLKTIDFKQINNPLLSKLIELITKNWNFQENNFIVNKKDKSKRVLKTVLHICIDNVENIKLRNEFRNEAKIIGF